MDVDDRHIPDELFAEFLQRMPQVSVELLLETDAGVLLVRRTQPPAQGEWFWPGTRLHKGEQLDDAAHRLASEELGIDIEITGRLGTYAHHWTTSAFDDVETTHTVNVIHRATTPTPNSITLDDTHDGTRFVTAPSEDLHPYVNEYLRDAGYTTQQDP